MWTVVRKERVVHRQVDPGQVNRQELRHELEASEVGFSKNRRSRISGPDIQIYPEDDGFVLHKEEIKVTPDYLKVL